MASKVESKKVKGNIVYEYIQDYNNAANWFNRFNFNKDNTPKPNAQASEPVKHLVYDEVVTLLNKMSTADEELCDEIIKKAWTAYYDVLRDELYPKIDSLIGAELDR